MIITIPRGDREYVPECDRDLPESEQTVFILGDLTERQRVRIMDTLQVSLDEGESKIGGSGTRVYQTVRAGLRGWKNLRDAEGAEVAFKKGSDGCASDESLAILPWSIKIELQNEILESTLVSEDDKGK